MNNDFCVPVLLAAARSESTKNKGKLRKSDKISFCLRECVCVHVSVCVCVSLTQSYYLKQLSPVIANDQGRYLSL